MNTTIRGGLSLIFLVVLLAKAPDAAAQTACSPTTTIAAIQGNSTTQLVGGAHDDISPLTGQTVTLEGVVVADFQSIPQPTRSGELRGFFLQQEAGDQDADPSTAKVCSSFRAASPRST